MCRACGYGREAGPPVHWACGWGCLDALLKKKFFVPSYLHQITVYMWKILVLQIKNMQVATSVKLDKSKLLPYVWDGED